MYGKESIIVWRKIEIKWIIVHIELGSTEAAKNMFDNFKHSYNKLVHFVSNISKNPPALNGNGCEEKKEKKSINNVTSKRIKMSLNVW